MKSNCITIMKFLNQFYGICGDKTRFMLHKDVINHYDGLEVANKEDENFYEDLACGKIIKVIDSNKEIIYYKIERSLLDNICYEEDSNNSYMDNFNDVSQYINISRNELKQMRLYELVSLRKKLLNDQRKSSGVFDNTIRNIKRELQYRKQHKNRKGEYYD